MDIVIKEFRDRILVFVECLGSRLSDFLGLGNKLETKRLFMKNRILSSGSGQADHLSHLKT